MTALKTTAPLGLGRFLTAAALITSLGWGAGTLPAQELPLPDLEIEAVFEELAAKVRKKAEKKDAKKAAGKTAAQEGRGRVHGRILDVDGKPIAGVGVILGSTKGLEASQALTKPLARTDADGRFSFELDAPKEGETKERRYLLAVAEGRLAARLTMPTVRYSTDRRWSLAKSDRDRLLQTGFDVLARLWGRATQRPADSQKLRDIVLRPGVRARGKVTDAAGKPLAGVRVVGNDLLTRSRFRGVQRTSGSATYVSYATTKADGTFDLPGLFATGAELRLTKDGYFGRTQAFIAGSGEVAVKLQKAAEVVGKIVGKDGAAAEASIRVAYESATSTQSVKVEKGEFRFARNYPNRFRLTVTPKGKSSKDYQVTYSAILTEAPKDFVIKLRAKKKRPPKKVVKKFVRPKRKELGFPIFVTDKATGRPILKFKSCVVWTSGYYAKNEPYLINRARSRGKANKQPGYARLMPPTSSSRSGGVVVLAKGYAPHVTLLDWDDENRPRIAAELVPESMITGTVRKTVSGEPMKSVRVRLNSYSSDRSRSYSKTARTDKDGRYQFRELMAGHYRVSVTHSGRSAGDFAVDLSAEEKRGRLDFSVGEGVHVRGQITGIEIGAGYKVELLRESYIRSMLSNPSYRPSGAQLKLKKDGKFEFKNVQPQYYEICLRIPQDARKGGDLQIPIEPIRVRNRSLDVVIDASEDRPGTIRGKVVLQGAKLPMGRLLVLLGPPFTNPYSYSYRSNIDISGTRSAVAADGSYAMDVKAGSHGLSVIDLVTGVTIFKTEVPLEIDSGETMTEDLEVKVAEVKLKIVPKQEGGSVAAAWLDIDVEHPQPPGMGIVFFGNATNKKATGVDLVGHSGELQLLLPPYKTTLRARLHASRLARGKSKPQDVIGDVEVTPELGKVTEVTLEVDVPTTGFDPEPPKAEPEEAKEAKKAAERKAVRAKAERAKAALKGKK